jgi:hypothetical protein
VVGAEDADAVGGQDQRGRDRVLVGLEQEPASGIADQPVLVMDEERLRAALSPQATEERQVRPEDEGVVEVDDVESAEPGEAGDERSVADREDGLGPVYLDARRLGDLARSRRCEDLDVVPALSLTDREAVGRVTGTARVGRKRRGQVGYSQACTHCWTKGGHVDESQNRVELKDEAPDLDEYSMRCAGLSIRSRGALTIEGTRFAFEGSCIQPARTGRL